MSDINTGACIADWYSAHKRDLPWRKTSDPYRIWLSEVILQQTQVRQGKPYYLRFLERYPTVSDLAESSEKEVLLLWQGLGYYTRARNLHACAQRVMADFGGRFPTDYQTLLDLPGIGSYTAAAVASLAGKQCVPVVDGNVFRTLARYYACALNISDGRNRAWFFDKAAALMDCTRPDDFNQGMMELGALICTPRNPSCEDCPLRPSCRAYAEGSQHLFPVKEKKKPLRYRFLHYYIVERQGRVLLHRREEKDIWKGLFEYLLIESDSAVPNSDIALSTLGELTPSLVKKECQLLTHQKLHLFFYHVMAPPGWEAPKGYEWHIWEEAKLLPMPIALKKHRIEKEQNSLALF